MNRKQRIRQATIRRLQAILSTDDPGLAEHVYDRQIVPQDAAAEARAAGLDIDTTFVNVDPQAQGHTVTCVGCGRTAVMPFAPPPGKVVICPDCIKNRKGPL
jgi:CxxC-x17-CxxC domain-containing protein